MKINNRYNMEILVVDVDRSGLSGDAYDNFVDWEKDHPHSGYKFGFCIIDTMTGFVPDNCNDWNDSPEEAMFDYSDNCCDN